MPARCTRPARLDILCLYTISGEKRVCYSGKIAYDGELTNALFRWGWIAYPAAVIVLVCSFVGYTVLQSSHTHLWKASILPAVFHSLPDIDQTEMPDLAFPVGMRRRAEALRAELKTVNDPGAEKARWAWRTR